jgi:hypothetical protein
MTTSSIASQHHFPIISKPCNVVARRVAVVAPLSLVGVCFVCGSLSGDFAVSDVLVQVWYKGFSVGGGSCNRRWSQHTNTNIDQIAVVYLREIPTVNCAQVAHDCCGTWDLLSVVNSCRKVSQVPLAAQRDFICDQVFYIIPDCDQPFPLSLRRFGAFCFSAVRLVILLPRAVDCVAANITSSPIGAGI